MTEHAWHVEAQYGGNISLMVLSNRTGVTYELTYNTTAMPVSIPVLVFGQRDFNTINKTYGNVSQLGMTITYAPEMPKKFRPAILLMFLLVLLILLCGNFWAADEFIRKVKNKNLSTQSASPSSNASTLSAGNRDLITDDHPAEAVEPKPAEITIDKNQSPSNSEPAILYMPYCIIALILCFAVGWILLIYYFPKVMIYVLQGKQRRRRNHFHSKCSVYFSDVLHWRLFLIDIMS